MPPMRQEAFESSVSPRVLVLYGVPGTMPRTPMARLWPGFPRGRSPRDPIIDADAGAHRESRRIACRARRPVRLPAAGAAAPGRALRATLPVDRQAPERRRPQLGRSRVLRAAAVVIVPLALLTALAASMHGVVLAALDAAFLYGSLRFLQTTSNLGAIERSLREGDCAAASRRLAQWQGEAPLSDEPGATARLAAEHGLREAHNGSLRDPVLVPSGRRFR